jgi:hypothetical protein
VCSRVTAVAAQVRGRRRAYNELIGTSNIGIGQSEGTQCVAVRHRPRRTPVLPARQMCASGAVPADEPGRACDSSAG